MNKRCAIVFGIGMITATASYAFFQMMMDMPRQMMSMPQQEVCPPCDCTNRVNEPILFTLIISFGIIQLSTLLTNVLSSRAFLLEDGS